MMFSPLMLFLNFKQSIPEVMECSAMSPAPQTACDLVPEILKAGESWEPTSPFGRRGQTRDLLASSLDL
jgi:hypothetical protein